MACGQRADFCDDYLRGRRAGGTVCPPLFFVMGFRTGIAYWKDKFSFDAILGGRLDRKIYVTEGLEGNFECVDSMNKKNHRERLGISLKYEIYCPQRLCGYWRVIETKRERSRSFLSAGSLFSFLCFLDAGGDGLFRIRCLRGQSYMRICTI